jgi:hypothetical protein
MAILALVWISAILIASAVWHPADASPLGNYYTLCGFKNLTGLPCPGCGLSHSFCALANGDIVKSFAFNLLGPPSFLLLILVWWRSALVLSRRLEPVAAFDRLIEQYRVVKRLAIAFAIFGTIRIGYVLAFRPELLENTPIARLASRVFG